MGNPNKKVWWDAERYPPRMVRAVLWAVRDDMRAAGFLAALDAGQTVEEHTIWDAYPEYYQNVHDTTSGVKLDPELIARARAEEMDFVKKDLDAYHYDTVSNCKAKTGKSPVPVSWVDVNKGDAQRPSLRSRLVVCEPARVPRSLTRARRSQPRRRMNASGSCSVSR